MRLLIAEDDPRLASLLRRGLTESGYVVDVACRGDDALHLLALYEYAAAVLDWRMPGLDGVEVIRAARSRRIAVPVLVLTARDGLSDRVDALDAGADDYLVKPFQFPELLARLRALQRRPPPLHPILELGGVRLDPATGRVTCDGAEVRLAPIQLGLLELMLRRHPAVTSRDLIAQHLWPEEWAGTSPNAIEVHVSRLRGKLSGSSLSLSSVRGSGYRLEER
jgi:DNA-binding response OmpR family regulator